MRQAPRQKWRCLDDNYKSKGLEFPVVFLIGMIEGILPDKKGDVEEERRCAFVAASRAMKILILFPYLYGETGKKIHVSG